MGSLRVTLLVFAVSLIAWQVAMRRLGPRRAFWQWIDYVWLSALGLGLITATGKARQMIATARVDSAEAALLSSVRMARSQAEFSRDYYLNWNFAGIPDDERRLEVKEAFTHAGGWFPDASNALSDSPPSAGWREMITRLPELERVEDEMVRRDAVGFARMLRRMQEDEEEYKLLRDSAVTNELEKWVIALSPWLIAFALATRFTKVTAIRMGFT